MPDNITHVLVPGTFDPITFGHMDVVRRAEDAYRAVGVTPVREPIRGGTDGSRLSFMGLPCPNLGTGGLNAHSRHELIAIEDMDAMSAMLIRLVAAR